MIFMSLSDCDLFWLQDGIQLRDLNPRKEFVTCHGCGAFVVSEFQSKHVAFHNKVEGLVDDEG